MMIDTKTYIYYLNDNIKELISMAQKIDKTNEDEFNQLFGYYHSISLLLNNAESFNILDSLNKEIQDFVPEKLL